MLTQTPRLFALPCLLLSVAGLAHATGVTDRHALDAPAIQRQQQPMLNQENLLQYQAQDAALQARGSALIRQCWSLLGQQATGPLHFKSVAISEEPRLYIRGNVSQAGGPAYRYSCRMDKGQKHFDQVELEPGPRPAEPPAHP